MDNSETIPSPSFRKETPHRQRMARLRAYKKAVADTKRYSDTWLVKHTDYGELGIVQVKLDGYYKFADHRESIGKEGRINIANKVKEGILKKLPYAKAKFEVKDLSGAKRALGRSLNSMVSRLKNDSSLDKGALNGLIAEPQDGGYLIKNFDDTIREVVMVESFSGGSIAIPDSEGVDISYICSLESRDINLNARVPGAADEIARELERYLRSKLALKK